MSDNIKVSVVLPNFNHKVFLKQRIESILNQTYQDFELIILDDASTDGSQELLDLYRDHDKVSQVLINDTNSGSVFKQWIKGINSAKGEYVWIAESDDFADDRFLEMTLEILETNKKLGLVFTDSIKVDENGRELGLVSKSKKINQSLGQANNLISKHNCAECLLEKLFIVNASSVLFRKSNLLTLNFDVLKTFNNTGDIFVYLGITLNYDAYFLSKPLNFMRLHEFNTTKINKTSGRIYNDKIKLLDFYLDDLIKIQSSRESVINYFMGLFFLSIDHGYLISLKKLLKRMYDKGLLRSKTYFFNRVIIFIYVNVLYKGKPLFMRKKLKYLLKNSF